MPSVGGVCTGYPFSRADDLASAHAAHVSRTGRSHSFAGQLAGLLHQTGELSFVELVGFPHVEARWGWSQGGRRNGREGGAVEEDQLEVALKAATARNQRWPGVDDRHYGARDDRANGAT
jgi:hypothetical protein